MLQTNREYSNHVNQKGGDIKVIGDFEMNNGRKSVDILALQ